MTTAGRFVVIGGGIGGASAAYRLARGGHDVTLIDRSDVGQATAADRDVESRQSLAICRQTDDRLDPRFDAIMRQRSQHTTY